MLEIEAKFAVRDEANLLGRLEACGFRIEQELDQADYYYNHPARDFRETDEAFRIRVSGEDLNLTYKGPRLDSRIKTRSEIELPLSTQGATLEAAQGMLLALGFLPVASVVKLRRQGRLEHEGFTLNVAIDRVVDAGDFIEIECLIERAKQQEATDCVLHFARQLGLTDHVTESYLGLVLRERTKAGLV